MSAKLIKAVCFARRGSELWVFLDTFSLIFFFFC